MPRAKWVLDDETSEESDYSETDVSYSHGGRRQVVKRRSFSRTRRRSPESNAYLNPAAYSLPVRRSASTGGRRRRGDDAVVVVDVHNDVSAKQESRERRPRYRPAPEDEIEEVEFVRKYRQPKIVTEVPVPRESSPRQRDWELLMDQRLLAQNDARQDMDLLKHQQEIERLERKLARSREKRHQERDSGSRHRHLAEEELWEDELAEKLRKLDRLERARRNDEEQKAADKLARVKRLEEIEKKMIAEEEQKAAKRRAKMERLEEMERKAAEEEEAKRLAEEKHLKEIEKREKAKAEKERYKQEIRDEEARKLMEEEERKKELDAIKAKAIQEWRQAEEARKLREIEEKREKDKQFKERLREEFGMTEEEIEKRLKKKEESEKKEDALVFVGSPPQKTTYIRVSWILARCFARRTWLTSIFM